MKYLISEGAKELFKKMAKYLLLSLFDIINKSKFTIS
jgi:hypothetical protein